MDYDYLYENGIDWQFLPPYMRSTDEYDGITIEEKETKEMTSYKIGDSVDHVMYGKCTITSLVSFEVGYIDVFSEDRGGIVPVSISDIKKIDEEKETKEMTSYKVGDYVDHPLYNESIITDISEFETGYISIIPLTGTCHGQTKIVSIDDLKKIDAFLISTEDYNEMARTIEELKCKNNELKDEIENCKHRIVFRDMLLHMKEDK